MSWVNKAWAQPNDFVWKHIEGGSCFHVTLCSLCTLQLIFALIGICWLWCLVKITPFVEFVGFFLWSTWNSHQLGEPSEVHHSWGSVSSAVPLSFKWLICRVLRFIKLIKQIGRWWVAPVRSWRLYCALLMAQAGVVCASLGPSSGSLRVPNLLHIRWGIRVAPDVPRCFGHSLQAGTEDSWASVSYGGARHRIFPFASTIQGTGWMLLTYVWDKVLVWVYRRMQRSSCFPSFKLPLLCLGEVLNQVFLHLEKLLQVWAGFWASRHLHPLGAKKVLFE